MTSLKYNVAVALQHDDYLCCFGCMSCNHTQPIQVLVVSVVRVVWGPHGSSLFHYCFLFCQCMFAPLMCPISTWMDIQDIAMVIDVIHSGFSTMAALSSGGAACTRINLHPTSQRLVMDSGTLKSRSSSAATALKDATTICFQSCHLSWSPRSQKVS